MSTVAALENLKPEVQQLLNRLGVDVVCVALQGHLKSPIWRDPDIAKSLADELSKVQAGRFDSSSSSGNRYFCFYHVHNLAKGVAALKGALESRGLLDHAAILVSESEIGKFRMYWPPEGVEV